MLYTVEIGSCVSVQGEFVGVLVNGDVVICDGAKVYRGRPVGHGDHAAMPPHNLHALVCAAAQS